MHMLAKQIRLRQTQDFHAHASLHAQLHGAQIKSLEELTETQMTSPFSEKDDTFLEERMKKLLEDRKRG